MAALVPGSVREPLRDFLGVPLPRAGWATRGGAFLLKGCRQWWHRVPVSVPAFGRSVVGRVGDIF